MKKQTLLFLTFLFFPLLAYALPGFEPYIQELPGQYVYYEDKTFERKSYFGILQYDKKTFAARYYAPSDAKEKKPETEVEIYFSIDETANHFELTGEKIISGFTSEEAELVNYMHDMLYELSARRIKIGALSHNKISVQNSEYFGQFGGYVTVLYDAIVPLFNVREVYQEEGSPEFFVVTTGQITGSGDKSFEKFKGFETNIKDSSHSMPKLKNISEQSFVTEDGIKVELDSAWSKAMDNVFMFGDAAFVSVGKIPVAPIDFLHRQLLLSTGDSYLDLTSTEVRKDDNSLYISGLYYQPESKSWSRNFKSSKKNESVYDFFTLTVYKNVYEKNPKYFQKILKANNYK